MMADGGWFTRITGTVRFRITALATLAVAAVLIVAGVGLVVAQRKLLTDNLEDALRQRASDLAVLVAQDRLPDVLATGGDDTLAQVVGPGGAVLAASPDLAGQPPLGDPPPAGQTAWLRTVPDLRESESFRLLSRRVDTPGGVAIVHVAGGLSDVRDSTRILTTTLTIAVPAVAAILAALVWWLVGRTLSPVEAIRARVAEMGGGDVERRVPEPGGNDEVARLARTMNAMLDRVEDASRRQQRFVADASHELRSPLTRIRSELEVDLAHPDGADLAATHRSVLEETTGLQHLVDDLLYLARSDAGATSSRRVPVDLDDIVLRETRRLRAAGRHVDITGVSAAQVHGDADQLTRAIRNLADNAARHAATTVTVTLAEADGHAVLTIADDGAGIGPEDRERVFERFTRLDDARTNDRGGTGLGLAITREVVDGHAGSVTIDPDHHPGTRFVVTLPS